MWTNAGTHTWYIPQGVTKVFAFVIGAGGGGYAYNDYYASKIFQGGKGGGYAHGVISGLTPGNTITVTVGLGGKGYSRNISGSGSAGGNSSFGSYLTGNGGGAGAELSSDNGDQRGQGGSASTSGVTEAYTAAGGGGGRWFQTTDQDSTLNDGRGQHGGGSSGSPFGPGNGPQRVQGSACTTGGAGWAHGQTWDGNFGYGNVMSRLSPHKLALPGDGSHYQISGQGLITFESDANEPTANGAPTQGGYGLTSRGGYSWSDGNGGVSVGGQNNTGKWASGMMTGAMDGEDKPWWFPWEVDGGGGGAVRMESQSGMEGCLMTAGSGGSGAGGGSIMGNVYNRGIAFIGGKGGFGGGGGGCRAARGHWNNKPSVMHGGQGGIGGGGGAAWTHKSWTTTSYSNDTNRSAYGGHGGNGCVCVYW